MTEYREEPHRPPETVDDAEMLRSDEELRIDTRRRETRRARLTKTIETRTETVTRSVPLRRERVAIEYEALDDGTGQPGADPAADRPWLVLYEEEVVVRTRWVARERVRLAVHTVTRDREITELLRREELTVDDSGSPERPASSAGFGEGPDD